MPSKEEKESRKQTLQELKNKTKAEFNNSLPISAEKFQKLFDHLDEELEEKGCDDTNNITINFLKDSNIGNIEEVMSWLRINGGYCDCEILANVEEKFE